MIWYRHWLELRRATLFLLAMAAVAGFFYARNLDREVSGLFVGNEPLRRGLARDFGPLLGTMTPTQTVAVAVHAQSTVYLILLAFLILGGNGLRIVEYQRRGTTDTLPVRAAPYTLSLPLSRARLIITRVVAGYAGGALFFALSLVVHRVALAVAGHDVPLLPMVIISLFATVVTLFWSAVLGFLTWLLGATFGLFVTIVAALFSSMAVYKGMGGIAADPAMMLKTMPMLFGIVTGVVFLAIKLVEGEEF